jgi:hypothetical protein
MGHKLFDGDKLNLSYGQRLQAYGSFFVHIAYFRKPLGCDIIMMVENIDWGVNNVDTNKPRTSAAVKNRYRDMTYDRAEIVLPKGRKAELKRYAKKRGESFNSFINRAVNETIERDSDDEFCEQLLDDYLACSDSEKEDFITIEDFAKELCIKL